MSSEHMKARLAASLTPEETRRIDVLADMLDIMEERPEEEQNSTPEAE